MSAFKAGDTVKVYGLDEHDYLPMFTGTVDSVGNHVSPDKITYKVIPLADQHGWRHDSFTIVDENQLRRAYTHISPSALFMFEENITEFYMRYVSRNRAPGIAQTMPMSIGSSFDAYVKSYIIKTLSQGNPVAPEYEFENMFQQQCEEINRKWARTAGLYAFECYKSSGALSDLMLELAQGDKAPRFEFSMQGLVKSEDKEIPLNGKPDLYFVNKYVAKVVADWKVNGFCSNSGQSPKPGYIMCRDGWVGKQSKNHRKSHKDAQIHTVKGIQVNVAETMESIDKKWALQLTIYGWLMGEPVGSQFIAGIEQLCCAPGSPDKPLIRVASYRNFISSKFQFEVFDRFHKCWTALKTGHYFTDLSRSDNDLKCMELERFAKSLKPTGDVKEDWMNNLNRVR